MHRPHGWSRASPPLNALFPSLPSCLLYSCRNFSLSPAAGARSQEAHTTLRSLRRNVAVLTDGPLPDSSSVVGAAGTGTKLVSKKTLENVRASTKPQSGPVRGLLLVDSLLANHHKGNLNFDVVAIPGAKINNFVSLLRNPEKKGGIDLKKYAFVAWLVGTNDLHQWVLARYPPKVPSHSRHMAKNWIPEGHVESEFRKLFTLVRSLSPGLPIHAFSILPRMLDFEQSEEQRQSVNLWLERACEGHAKEAPCHYHDIGYKMFTRQSLLKDSYYMLYNARGERDELHLNPRAKYHLMRLVRERLPKSGVVHTYVRKTKDGTLRLRKSIRPLSSRPKRCWEEAAQGPPKRAHPRDRRP